MTRGSKTLALLKAALALCCGLLLLPSLAHSGAPQWSGSLKSLNLYGEDAPADLFPSYRLSSNRARLNTDWQPNRTWQLEAALDYEFLWSDPKTAFPVRQRDRNRRLDMDKTWQHGNHGTSYLQADRLNLGWHSKRMDVTLGRQAIGFGRILIYSPLDVIAPFAPDALDTDIRNGVDATRFIYNYGLDGQIGANAVWGESNSDNSFLATWTDNRHGVDLLMITGSLRDRAMFGAGLAGSIGTVGLKGEFSVYKGKDTNKPDGDLHDSYALAAIETWYRFDSGISLVLQYLYNGPGVDSPEDYYKALTSAPLQEGLTYLLGRHYLMAAPSYEIHPLVSVQGLLIYNIDDESALFRPTLDLNLTDNMSLQLFWTGHVGRKPRVSSSFQPPEPRSEFGMIGDSGGLFLKYFF
jgi:hypothetical protein